MRAASILAFLLFALAHPAAAAGIERLSIAADARSPALDGAVWYPCDVPGATIDIRGVPVSGATDCPISGGGLGLIVFSHGAFGWFAGHHDTAAALADAGFVVAAVTHPDKGRKTWRTRRPRAMSRVIDHMLDAWPHRDRLDPARIGVFGFSRGGYTALVLIGGEPAFWRLLWHCVWNASEPMCKPPRRGHEDTSEEADEADEADADDAPVLHDPRIRAAVVAAPLGIVFAGSGLKNVRVPVQLWRAEHDQIVRFPDHAEAVYRGLGTEPDYRVVRNAGHFAFMAPCAPVQEAKAAHICTDPPGFDRAAFHAEFNAGVAAFFQDRLGAAP